MSDYEVVDAASRALRRVLWDEIAKEDPLKQIVQSEEGIVFQNPTEAKIDSDNRISLWLYQVAENEFVKNQPPMRGVRPGSVKPPPLALNLSYLLTPLATSGASDRLLLGKAMQVFYDNSIILLREGTTIAEELHVVLCRLTLEELTRVWEALREPYRLSICYQVRVTRIESGREVPAGIVVERRADYGTPTAEEGPRA